MSKLSAPIDKLRGLNGYYGVEPNTEMRERAESQLRSYPFYTGVDGTAEQTTLADHCAHFITAGQAFHWFDPKPTRKEFLRILIPNGRVVLIWNMFRNNGSLFDNAFEQFWRKHISDSEIFNAPEHGLPDDIARFIGVDSVRELTVANPQVYNWRALQGRIRSSSRAPKEGEPAYEEMMAALTDLFEEHNEDEKVTIEHDTQIILEQLT
ncbi:MAG: methyltransferase domain-containing protein [Chloroflexota bacterium]